MKNYRIGRMPNLIAQRNIKTWAYIKNALEKHTTMDYDSLVALCAGHDHPTGGRGFVDYCIKNSWLVKAENQNKKRVFVNANAATEAEKKEENHISNIYGKYPQPKNRKKFNMLILGEISEDQYKFSQSLNNYFEKYGIKSNEWSIDFRSNKDQNSKGTKNLKQGQSKYDLIITAQIHKHSSPRNEQGNLTSELMKTKYVETIRGCRPNKILTVDAFINKVHENEIHKNIINQRN